MKSCCFEPFPDFCLPTIFHNILAVTLKNSTGQPGISDLLKHSSMPGSSLTCKTEYVIQSYCVAPHLPACGNTVNEATPVSPVFFVLFFFASAAVELRVLER